MTAQIHETLIINGKATSMAFCPPLPEDHPRIRAVEPDDSPADANTAPIEDLLLNSTACRRGYEGTWVIEDDRLFLAGLRGKWELLGDEPLFADWFSGEVTHASGWVGAVARNLVWGEEHRAQLLAYTHYEELKA